MFVNKSILFLMGVGLTILMFACSQNQRGKQAGENKQSIKETTNTTFTNPVMQDGADPWITRHKNFYYFMVTQGDSLVIWRSEDPIEIATGEWMTVWKPPESGPNSSSIWAPELHRIEGSWYIYYTATDKEDPGDDNRYVFALENKTENPLTGEWIDHGRINTEYTGLDGSVFSWEGQRYFLYSAYKDAGSVLMIARMKNPWTLQGKEVEIARPEYDWEMTEKRKICEAPQFLEGPLDKNFIIYSASACWDDYYALGRLTIEKSADPMNSDVWKKHREPVFIASEENGVWGTGHNAFFMSPDSTEYWIAYHGKDTASGKCAGRSTRMQPFAWTDEGYPFFGEPVATSDTLQRPSRSY